MLPTRSLTVLAFAVSASVLGAQGPNPTNLWSVALHWKGDSLIVGQPKKLTHDDGLNSQPSFSPDGRWVVFSATRDTGRDARSDIYRVELTSGREMQVTHTPENENSPTVNSRGEYAAIRWVPSTLFKEYGPWMYSADGTPRKGILRGPDSTGYYTPLPNGNYALTRPKSRSFTIGIFDARSGVITDIDSGVPALPAQRIPGERALSYVRIDTATGHHELRRYDLATKKASSLGPTIAGRTAHAWLPGKHVVLMAKSNALLMRRVGRDTAWRRIATFADPQLRNASAYVVSPAGDRLILTSQVRPPLATLLRDSLEAGAAAQALGSRVLAWRDAGGLADYDVTEGSFLALANERLQKNHVSDATALADLAIAMWPGSARAFAVMGDAQRTVGDNAAAIAAYQKALDLNPRSTDDERKAAEMLERKIREAGGSPVKP